MNRKAKRNKHKKEITDAHIKINEMQEELDKNLKAAITANFEVSRLSYELDKSEEEKKKYQDKYYEQLKKEFLDGTKELLTVSVNVEKNVLPYPQSINKEYVDNERRKYICHEIAQYLYDNQQAFQVVEHDTYTRYNLVLVQNNPNKRGISEEDFDAMMERYGNKDIFDSVTKDRSSSIRFNPIGAIDSPFMR